MKNVSKIAADLIKIPSYVDRQHNEIKAAQYVWRFLKKEAPGLRLQKQMIGKDGRYNILASDSYPTKVLFACHMDTVQPRIEYESGPLSGSVDQKYVYGLGSVDMKGGMAALLAAVAEIKKTKGLGLLFYCDEEYYFLGMQKFLESYKEKPELIIIPESSDLKIWNGCRGIIELKLIVRGKTGHAARPHKAKNAIKDVITINNYIEKLAKKYTDQNLGASTVNLAFIEGGLGKEILDDGIIYDRAPSSVPDLCYAIIEIRSTNSKLNNQIDGLIRNFCSQKKINLLSLKMLEIKPYFITKNKLKKFERIISQNKNKVEYADISQKGYTDGQMIYERLGLPAVCFGPGLTKFAHSDNEKVLTSHLDKCKIVFIDVIREYSSAIMR